MDIVPSKVRGALCKRYLARIQINCSSGRSVCSVHTPGIAPTYQSDLRVPFVLCLLLGPVSPVVGVARASESELSLLLALPFVSPPRGGQWLYGPLLPKCVKRGFLIFASEVTSATACPAWLLSQLWLCHLSREGVSSLWLWPPPSASAHTLSPLWF